MATTTINPPIQFVDVQGTLGHAFLFAQEEIRSDLQDRLNVLGLGVVGLVGDVMGTGTDTLRITDMGNVGWSIPFTALASETDTVAPSPIDIGFETVTVGTFGLSHSETYTEQVFNREGGISLDALKAKVPMSWMRTFRDQVTLTGSGITTAVGSAATTMSVDDHLDLLTAYRTTLGSRIPTAFLDPDQMDELLRSYRNEPAFTNNAEAFARLFRLAAGDPADVRATDVTQIHRNFADTNLDIALTDSIVQSGGAFQGFAFSPGGIGWAVGSTLPIRPANPVNAVYVPQFGLFIEELTEGGKQTVRQYRATSFFGTALASERTHVLRRWISTT